MWHLRLLDSNDANPSYKQSSLENNMPNVVVASPSWQSHVCRFALLIFAVFGLFGCREDLSPIVASTVIDDGLFLGKYTVEQKDKQPKVWQLSDDQLRQMTSWFKDNKSGWGLILASPPPPSFSILFKHEDGSWSQLDLFSFNESWKQVVIFRASNPKNNGIKSLTPQGRNALLQLVAQAR
jgi:hypothetical protein